MHEMCLDYVESDLLKVYEFCVGRALFYFFNQILF